MSVKTDEVIRPCYDEMFAGDGAPRPIAEPILRSIGSDSLENLRSFQSSADITLRHMGITFNVYGHEDATERIWPFDVIPRVLPEADWLRIEAGLKQRIRALNFFIADIHDKQAILKDGFIPRELILSALTLRKECMGLSPPHDVWCHITGTDLVRDANGQFYVLEDNLRCPSGASYVIENREVMKRTLPHIFSGLNILPVEDYPERLLAMLINCAPTGVADPTVVVLSPGSFNSAYFEHTFLAQQMGVALVEGSDLVVDDEIVYAQTVSGRRRVDVIYRRIDDDFLDPSCFRSDSVLGVSGLMKAYRAGNVTLANAPGTGVADDKAVYYYVPKMIEYYLREEAILPNVPTYLCSNKQERQHVLANLDQLVVKPTNESGGYGILMGPQATAKERSDCADRIRANPRNYVAQPMLTLSTVPTICNEGLESRHVDLRPFILHGPDEIYILPGGLTRVALKRGSMVVNSSQGGGSKDTWVLRNGFHDPDANSLIVKTIEPPTPDDGQAHQWLDVAEATPLEMRDSPPVLSRVAESVFWMARHLERAENIARFVDVNFHLSLDAGNATKNHWAALVDALGDEENFFQLFDQLTRDNVLNFLVLEHENPNSILSCLRQARENARVSRGVISGFMWEEVNKLFLAVGNASQDVAKFINDPHRLLQIIKLASQALVGITDAYMSHGHEWHFARLGRLLERADKTSRILHLKQFAMLSHSTDLGTPLDIMQWSAVLKSVSALAIYRRRHGRISPTNVADFLILDRHFSRSLNFCLTRALESIHEITDSCDGISQDTVESLLHRTRSRLGDAKPLEIFRSGLHQFVDDFQRDLNRDCDSFYAQFFHKSKSDRYVANNSDSAPP